MLDVVACLKPLATRCTLKLPKLLVGLNWTIAADVRLVATSVGLLARCLVTGFFANVAKLSPDGHYRTVRDGTVIAIHPSSVLAHFGSPPEWILFHDISKTSQLFARDVSVVDPR